MILKSMILLGQAFAFLFSYAFNDGVKNVNIIEELCMLDIFEGQDLNDYCLFY